ncbi:MAG: hypothetical protein RIT04_534, partial [Candidatus Parcubacteria bacterium]
MTREFRLKSGERLLTMINKFSATEKVLFGILFVILTVSSATLALRVNRLFMIPIPAQGGSIIEGVVGLPRLINPVIAVSDVDRDIASLIYSGLLKNKNGSLTPDLAASYTVSDDGLTYTFTLKANARFHDGEQVTASDVAFTIEKIQDPAIQSPHRVDWKDTQVKVLNPAQIQFTLKQAYAPFINNFTIGIIPKHIWNNVDTNAFILSKYNIEPIGSGPYQLDNITQNSGGIPTTYSLIPFSGYVDGKAYISLINIEFFANETTAVEAIKNGTIDSLAAVSPGEALSIASGTSNTRVLSTPLPRIFG